MTKMRLVGMAITLALSATLVTVGAQGGGQAPQAPPAGQGGPGQAKFAGTPIDVDYQNANLRTVLRNLAEIGGLNLVIDPSVPPVAPVDLKLVQVPWDQVLDVVMRSASLTYEFEGAVLRVLTREAMT